MPLVLIGGALVVVGAFKGIRAGRAGEAFFTTRPYKILLVVTLPT